MKIENKEIYILGDLNINLLAQNVSIAKKLQEIMELYQLTKIIDDPTRITESTKSLLDVCITSSTEKIISLGVIHLGISDHSLIYAIRKLNYVPKTEARNSIEYRNFKHFNAESFLNDLYCCTYCLGLNLMISKLSMRCGNAGNLYLFKNWINMPHSKLRE